MGTAYYWKEKEARAVLAQTQATKMFLNYNVEITECVNASKIYTPDTFFDTTNWKQKEQLFLTLKSIDSVGAIFDNQNIGKTAVLNFASYKNPGGKFLEGSRAQEESLCHNSYLFNVLNKFSDYYAWNNEHKNNGLYLNRAIYSPNVLFFSGDKKKSCDVITCAAPNRFRHTKATKEENTEALNERIRFILNIAADNKVDNLILGAFGCGVFNQDATEVAQIFLSYLMTTRKLFNTVIFAIPKSNNDDNYNKFMKAFKGKK